MELGVASSSELTGMGRLGTGMALSGSRVRLLFNMTDSLNVPLLMTRLAM